MDGKAHFEAMVAANYGKPVPPPQGDYQDPASFNHKFATVSGGYRYHYVEEGDPSAPVMLMVHGFPDLWYGWRYQIRHLAAKGFRVIAVDTLGYGQSDAPKTLEPYRVKNICEQLCSLLDVLKVQKATVIGHDWGGAIVWRFADYHPDRVESIISVCTPTMPLMDVFYPLEVMAEKSPNFAYQMFFCDPATTDLFNSQIPGVMTTTFKYHACRDIEIDYYSQEFARNGFLGPLNYYRNRKNNFDDELALPRNVKRPHPACLIVAEDDPVLHPSMSEKMHEEFSGVFDRVFVKSAHFAATENPKAVNEAIDNFLAKVYPNGPKAKI